MGINGLPPTLFKTMILLMGHLHPVVVLHDQAGFRIARQVRIKAQIEGQHLPNSSEKTKKVVFKGDQIPNIGPVLRSRTVDFGISEIHLLDGTYLGTLNQLINLN